MFHEASEADQRLLTEWRWLLGGLPRLLGWSSGGDLLIENPDGSIALLDPGGGDLERIADSLHHLREQLEWTMADLARQRPGITVSELAELLDLDEETAAIVADKTRIAHGVAISDGEPWR